MRDFEKALEAQLDLIHVLRSRNPIIEAGFHKWAEGGAVKSQLSVEELVPVMRETYIERLDAAETVWVSAEMMKLVGVAAESLPPHELHPTDLPMKSGFIYFDKPLVIPASPGSDIDTVSIKAAVWWEADSINGYLPGVEVLWWVDPRGAYLGHDTTEWGMPRWYLDTISGWSYGKDWQKHRHIRDPEHVAFDVPDMLHTWDARHLLSLWMLMKQRVAGTTRVEASRKLRRRAIRTSPEFGTITVVDLRRQTTRDPDAPEREEGDAVEWSHRWVVSGHWRKQHYASEGVHRPIWISPFVKGPEDAPLILKDRVYRLVR